MIEISLGKLVLLALIALIVLGPEKLPGAARTAGALLRRVRSGWDNVRAEVEREMEIEEIKRAAREAAGHAEAAQNALKDGLQQVHDPLLEVASDVTAVMQPLPTKAAEPGLIDHEAVVGEAAADFHSDDLQAALPLGEPVSEPAGKPAHDHT